MTASALITSPAVSWDGMKDCCAIPVNLVHVGDWNAQGATKAQMQSPVVFSKLVKQLRLILMQRCSCDKHSG